MSEIDTSEFHEYLKIDTSNLDTDMQEQPVLFFRIGDAYTEAVALRDTYKESLSMIDAELSEKYSSSLEKQGKRSTKDSIEAAVLQDTKHIKASRKFLNAKAEAEKFLVLKESFQMRSYMLRDLASLYIANYYERDAAKGITSDEKEFKATKIREKMDEKRKANRKRERRT